MVLVEVGDELLAARRGQPGLFHEPSPDSAHLAVGRDDSATIALDPSHAAAGLGGRRSWTSRGRAGPGV